MRIVGLPNVWGIMANYFQRKYLGTYDQLVRGLADQKALREAGLAPSPLAVPLRSVDEILNLPETGSARRDYVRLCKATLRAYWRGELKREEFEKQCERLKELADKPGVMDSYEWQERLAIEESSEQGP